MNAITQTAKHSAPGQYLGYGLQSVRLCYHLLTSTAGSKVSVEHLDDITVQNIDGTFIFEQCKSALKGNPISDTSSELWKTIRNWLDLIEDKQIDPDSSYFRLYVTPIRKGVIAAALSAAVSEHDVEHIIKVIESGPAKSKTRACAANVKRFLDANPVHRQALVSRITVESEDSDPVESIRSKLTMTVDPNVIDMICQWAIGSAKEKADKMIREGKVATLEADVFKSEFRDFVKKNNLPGLLVSFTGAPEIGEMRKIIEDRPTFVRQLEIIDLPSDGFIRAVGDYLRTAADISIWGERGMIFEKNLRDWNDELIGRFEHIAGEIGDTLAKSDAPMRGRVVYRRCASLQAPLDGRVVPGHFVHGSFNALANERRLGWHPEYRTLLDALT